MDQYRSTSRCLHGVQKQVHVTPVVRNSEHCCHPVVILQHNVNNMHSVHVCTLLYDITSFQ